MKQLQQVKEWHEAFGVPIGETPYAPDYDRQKLRQKLLLEEIQEFADEMNIAPCVDMRAVAKELSDILYILLGTVLEFGLQDEFERCFDEVHRSNMSKLGRDGKPVYREDGKVLKGPDFSPADLSFL